MNETKSAPCLYELNKNGLPGSWWKGTGTNITVCCSNGHESVVKKEDINNEATIEEYWCSQIGCSYPVARPNPPQSLRLEGFKQWVMLELKKLQKKPSPEPNQEE